MTIARVAHESPGGSPHVEIDERLAALEQELLGTPPEPAFDRCTAALRRVTGATVAAFVLADGHRHVSVKSFAGVDGLLTETFVIGHQGQVAELLLARAHRAGPSGTQPAAYARAPVSVDDQPVGWMAIADVGPRAWTEDDREALAEAAAAVSTELRLRVASRETERVRALHASQTGVHELIAKAAPLNEVLTELVRGIEAYDPSVLPCVVLLDRESSTLHPGAGPSLPPEWLEAIDGAVIGPNIGTCGAAAWSGQLTITEDIAEDPKWAPIREPALALGLRHCWSMPIKAADGDVLGTLAFYGGRPRAPRPEQLVLMADSARLAGIAIERHGTMERLLHDARHDGLTGLANRTAIFEHLDEAIAHRRRESHVAVLFIDLDRLKSLNDTFGHNRADEMLREVGRRIAACMRPGDFVGRFGGDEFVAIAEGVGSDSQAADIGSRLLEAISEPLSGIEGAVVTASIGIALLRGTTTDAREALREADSAMYAAKRSGRDRLSFFEGKQPGRTGRHLALVRELKDAETRGEMAIVFQPVFDVVERQIVAVEALLRWTSPKLGAVSPVEFIPVAEDTGAIVPLGAWVLRESCEAIAPIIRDLGRPLELGVNVSARQIARPGFAKSVRQIVAHAEFPANLLTLEITETALLRPDAVTIHTLNELDAAGTRLVLDDFGTGYSSLSWLKHQPLDAIKIDRSFISGLPEDARDAAVVAGLIGIAKALGYTVTAEGVETEVQLEALRTLGCERAQGYLLAYPIGIAELRSLLIGAGGRARENHVAAAGVAA